MTSMVNFSVNILYRNLLPSLHVGIFIIMMMIILYYIVSIPWLT